MQNGRVRKHSSIESVPTIEILGALNHEQLVQLVLEQCHMAMAARRDRCRLVGQLLALQDRYDALMAENNRLQARHALHLGVTTSHLLPARRPLLVHKGPAVSERINSFTD